MQRIKNAVIEPLSDFKNLRVRFTFGRVVNAENEFQYVMMATQGKDRIVLGGNKDQVKNFLETALHKLAGN